MTKRISNLTIGLCVVVLCLGACKSAKDAAHGTQEVYTATMPDRFSARMKLTLPHDHKSQTVNGTVKMVRNERIQLSFVAPVLRTEAFRIEVTPARLTVIDRMNKQYAIAPACQLQALLGEGMDFDRLQTILSQAVFLQTEAGWTLRTDQVEIAIPLRQEDDVQRLQVELSRITMPHHKPTPTSPPGKYEKRELHQLIESLEEAE